MADYLMAERVAASSSALSWMALLIETVMTAAMFSAKSRRTLGPDGRARWGLTGNAPGSDPLLFLFVI